MGGCAYLPLLAPSVGLVSPSDVEAAHHTMQVQRRPIPITHPHTVNTQQSQQPLTTAPRQSVYLSSCVSCGGGAPVEDVLYVWCGFPDL
jgi:hypothetical protein